MPESQPWHAIAADEAAVRLGYSASGLTAAAAAERLRQVGPNALPEATPPTLAGIFFRQFFSPLIYILLFAAVLAAFMGDAEDALFILAALIINAGLGTWQEAKADRSSRALQRILQIRATVLRDGEISEIAAEQLVPGDIIELESGARVPADARLLAARGLEVDESLLTGESLAVFKDADWTGPAAAPLAERRNMVHAGTLVVRGRASAVVTATGSGTAVGVLAVAVIGVPPAEPPLMRRMAVFSRRIGVAILVATVLIAGVGVFARGYSLVEMLMFGIALAVSAIPEGLPIALTVTLAVCTSRMARRGVIVRRLAAVEGLGSCTLIASDKTGTLTCNELTVRAVELADGSVYSVTGEGFVPAGAVQRNGVPVAPGEDERLDEIARASVLCNEAQLHARGDGWTWRGDPTDVALLAFAHKLGWKKETTLLDHPQLGAIAFEPESRYAASFHRMGAVTGVLVKGAPERIAVMCADGREARRMLEDAAAMAARGLRVLAVAAGELPAGQTALAAYEPSRLRLLGLVGMIDPARAGVREAVRSAARAGVTTIMVTGDHPVTALAIARDLGLAEGPAQVRTGDDIAGLGARELADLMAVTRVFARVAPEQKLAIVNAAKAAGHVVAVTGDGVNDAPALRAADIGVAMGRGGTDVARDAAELVITDDHYATITVGIEEGRIAYDNIRKVIYLVVSTAAAEVLFVGLAVLTGAPLPLTPVQLLWLNLVTNGIQVLSLGFEPGEQGILGRPPRPASEGNFNRLMIERCVVAALVMGGTGFAVFHQLLDAGWTVDAARNTLLLLMVLFLNIHLLNCRSETRSAFATSLRQSPVLVGGAAGALALHAAMMHLPLGQLVLHTAPLDAATWGALLGLACTVLVAMELHKLWWRRVAR